MKKINVVKKNYEFNDIIKKGKTLKNKFYIVYFKKNNLSKYRFGISVSKKLGNAVLRNKYKRKLRNIIDNNKKSYQKSYDYIIILRKSCIDVEFQLLEEKFKELIEVIDKRGELNEKN